MVLRLGSKNEHRLHYQQEQQQQLGINFVSFSTFAVVLDCVSTTACCVLVLQYAMSECRKEALESNVDTTGYGEEGLVVQGCSDSFCMGCEECTTAIQTVGVHTIGYNP